MGTLKSQVKPGRLPELDALRGIAALMVVVFHFTMDREGGNSFLKYGVTGVDFFFIISGFVIFLTLSKTKHWMDFVVSRFSRLYPAYWTVVTFTAVMTVVYRLAHKESMDGLFSQYLGNMTMLQWYFKIVNLDEPYWTLLIELQFYALMLLVFKVKWLSRVVVLGILGLLLVLFNHSVLQGVAPLFFKFSRWFLGLLNHFPLFFAGILFYQIKHKTADRLTYILSLVACYAAQIILFPDGGTANLYISQGEYAMVLAAYFGVFLLYSLDIPLFIVNKTTVFLGSISYSLYLVHKFVCVHLIIPALMNAGWNLWAIVFGICLPVVIALSAGITFWIEKPAMRSMRNWYKEFIDKKKAPETAVP